MVFNTKKYFAVLIILITVICFTIPLSCFSSDSANAETNVEIGEIIPEENDVEVDKNVPTFKNGFSLWSYANNKLENGVGTEAEFMYSGKGSLAGISYAQLVYSYIWYDNEKRFEIQNMTTDSEFGETACNYSYYDGNVVKQLWTNNVSNVNTTNLSAMVPNYGNKKPNVYNTLQEWEVSKYRDFRLFPFDVNSTTATVNYFKSDKNYYYCEYYLYPNKISDFYLTTIKHTLRTNKIYHNGILLTCVVSKKTGNFIQIERSEDGYFTFTEGILSVDIPVELITNYRFKKVDTEVKIPDSMIELFNK